MLGEADALVMVRVSSVCWGVSEGFELSDAG